MNESVILETRALSIRFGGVIAADNVSMKINAGTNLAIIGPNGAGKTTFLNICTGYLQPQSGNVLFEGRDITHKSPQKITRMGVARAFQIPQLFIEHTVLQNLLIATASRENRFSPFIKLESLPERDEMLQLLELVDCRHLANRLVNELPEGQRKLIDIALALALKPRLLLMDEPTSGVASSEKYAIMDILTNALQQANVTSVFVEHDMGIVDKYADDVAVWSSGTVQFRGKPAEILNHPEVIRDVIGLEA